MFSYLIIILLYAPCVATIGAMIREGGNRWMSISMLWSLVLSYALAVICYQASRLMIAPQSSLLWIGAMLGLIIGLSLLLIKLSKQQQQQSLIIAVG